MLLKKTQKHKKKKIGKQHKNKRAKIVGGDEVDKDEGEEWQIEAIILGDGTSVGGVLMKDDKWYGTAGNCENPHGYHPIQIDSVTLASNTERKVHFPTCEVAKTMWVGVPKRCEGNREAAIAFCEKFPGWAVMIGHGLGNREMNKKLIKYRWNGSPMPLREAKHLDCVPIAVFSAVLCLRGMSEALGVVKKLQVVTLKFRKLGEVGPIMRGLRLKLDLKREKKIRLVLGNMESRVRALDELE